MPFGLKNADATYQRIASYIFGSQIGSPLTSSITLKSSTFSNTRISLNADKSTCSVRSDKFLGHLVTRRGIEVEPTQIKAIEQLKSPTTI